MKTIEAVTQIAAPVHAVWSILDDLGSYPEWNPILPNLAGRTLVGETLCGDLVIPGMETPPFAPKITRIVPLRELRWVTVIPGDAGFTAEHIFLLAPCDGGTRLTHREIFDGPAVPHLAPAVDGLVKPAYDEFDRRLKARAEAHVQEHKMLHPALDNPAGEARAECRLQCRCGGERVELAISAPAQHNHLCGCSQCWKPDGSVFAQIAVVPADAVTVICGQEKLRVVNDGSAIARHACSECHTHMVGTVANPLHHFFGLCFVHPELADRPFTGRPEFAGFVSSLIAGGTPTTAMAGIRRQLTEHGIPAFDQFSPEIMDVIEYHKTK